MKLSHIIIVALFLLGCEREQMVEPVINIGDPTPDMECTLNIEEEHVHDQLFFSVTEDQKNWIYDSRDTTYYIEDPVPMLRIKNEDIEIRQMKTRGSNASKVRRKSFGIDTEEKIHFENRDKSDIYKTKDFRLLAMSHDFCYIENRIGFGLLQEAELFPLFFKYVEVFINEEPNGVYLLMENPNDYFIDRNDHSIVIRRGYYNAIESIKYEDNGDGYTEEDYKNAFKQIYVTIKDYSGEELFSKIDEVLNFRGYMRKIAFDYLIKNGDYTDEIYFYDVPGDDRIRFDVISWDLDDIFSYLPHELYSNFGTGEIFGEREYKSMQDVINAVGEKLIFSIEDDLDYIIALDPYLYSIYLEELKILLNTITEEVIHSEFGKIEQEIIKFFDYSCIEEQTQYDIEACDSETLKAELIKKETFLIERRQEILDQI